MALARTQEWNDGDILTDTALEAALDRLHNNPLALISPLTGNLDFDGNQAISLVMESNTSDPGAELNEGRLHYRSDINQPTFYDGTGFAGIAPNVWRLTNKSGGGLVEGDVVIVDSSNASAVTTTTTSADLNTPMVCLETVAIDATGLFANQGYVVKVNVDAATSIADYLATSTTAKKSTPGSTFRDGVFAQALTSAAGVGTVSAIIGGPMKITADLPKGHLDGGAISNNSGDSTNDLDFTACECRSDDDTANISVSALTKQIDAEWASGTNAGLLAAADDPIGASGLNVILWAIGDTAGSVSDFFASTSTSPSLPTGYDVKRQVGWIRWDGATIEQFDQVGTGRERFHRYRDPIQDVNDATITANTAETATMTAPPSSIVHGYIVVSNTSSTCHGNIFPTNASDDTTQIDESYTGGNNAGANTGWGGGFVTPLDSSSQCKYMADESVGATTLKVNTHGFWIYL
jgi:hypothetical protein